MENKCLVVEFCLKMIIKKVTGIFLCFCLCVVCGFKSRFYCTIYLSFSCSGILQYSSKVFSPKKSVCVPVTVVIGKK